MGAHYFSYCNDRLIGNVYLRKHKRQMMDTKITSKEEEEEEVKGIWGKKQSGKSSSEDEKGTLERRGPEQRVESFPLITILMCALTNQV